MGPAPRPSSQPSQLIAAHCSPIGCWGPCRTEGAAQRRPTTPAPPTLHRFAPAMQLCMQARSDCLSLGRRQPGAARSWGRRSAVPPSLRPAAGRRQLGTRSPSLAAQVEMDSHPLTPPPPPSAAAPSLGQRVLRIAGTAGVTVALALASASPAFAARSGGRIGGSSFGGSRFSSSGSYGSGTRGGAAAAASRGSWGGGAMSSGSWGAGAKSSGTWRGYGSSSLLTGGFGSSYSSPSTSVRTNSFFLSPWGFGELRCSPHLLLLPGPEAPGLSLPRAGHAVQ